MPGKIFISYRRDDAKADARNLRDRLAAAFGSANVFMDVDNLQAGQRFDQELDKALAQCDVLLAVIGPRWQTVLAERQSGPERDYVCDEIAAAIARGVIVIPVLVDGAKLPRGDQLPEVLRPLTSSHGPASPPVTPQPVSRSSQSMFHRAPNIGHIPGGSRP